METEEEICGSYMCSVKAQFGKQGEYASALREFAKENGYACVTNGPDALLALRDNDACGPFAGEFNKFADELRRLDIPNEAWDAQFDYAYYEPSDILEVHAAIEDGRIARFYEVQAHAVDVPVYADIDQRNIEPQHARTEQRAPARAVERAIAEPRSKGL